MGGLTAPLDWPAQAVALAPGGTALVLLTLPPHTARPQARRHARQALQQMLGALLARPAQAIILREDARGPLLDGAARDIRISLSYAANRCLIGLTEGLAIGVDIVRIENLPESESLARLYLPDAACRALPEAPGAARDAGFALAWAQMEARSKCLGLPLAEIDAQREQALNACALSDCAQTGAYRIALATRTL